ncbi:LysM peptidoglycan-binding domain-containing protein [Candidatus Daviesbacteria bacterium]|nr:LysM peptidoglycan-binding domain-containing protein [Candidatus Daviesbacteria bacterium]
MFTIAEKYYQDGSKFEDLAKANNLTDVDAITAGQVLEIPKLEIASLPNPSETPSPSPSPEITTPNTTDNTTADAQWGPKITGNTYTVQEGDWLSIIAGRAYGDIFTYQKIAEANNISNPDLIYPGQVLTIPR